MFELAGVPFALTENIRHFPSNWGGGDNIHEPGEASTEGPQWFGHGTASRHQEEKSSATS